MASRRGSLRGSLWSPRNGGLVTGGAAGRRPPGIRGCPASSLENRADRGSSSPVPLACAGATRPQAALPLGVPGETRFATREGPWLCLWGCRGSLRGRAGWPLRVVRLPLFAFGAVRGRRPITRRSSGLNDNFRLIACPRGAAPQAPEVTAEGVWEVRWHCAAGGVEGGPESPPDGRVSVRAGAGAVPVNPPSPPKSGPQETQVALSPWHCLSRAASGGAGSS